MGLKDRLSGATSASNPSGFQLVKPPTLHFNNPTDFEAALKSQADHVAVLDADMVSRIDVDGRIEGTDWRLSQAAFGDLCNFAGVPVAFIKKLCLFDEQQALDVMETMIAKVFRAHARQLVLDTASGRVDGIVGADSYAHISNRDAFTYLMTATSGLELSNGWIAGPDMRATVISKNTPAEVKKGDIVHFGVNMVNAIHGDRALKVSEYVERLVCTNGAVATEDGHFTNISHRGDVQHATQKAVVQAAVHAEVIFPVLAAAPHQLMLPKDINRIRNWLATSTGGSSGLDQRVTKGAMQEALKENRAEEETTLWNWHNSITALAKESGSMTRRAELEAMGYKSLIKFGVPLA